MRNDANRKLKGWEKAAESGKSLRAARRAAICALVVLGAGCQQADDDERAQSAADEDPVASASALTAARQAEVDAHMRAKYFSRFRIAETKAGPFGEVVDWVDPHELDPLFDQRVPPPADAVIPNRAPINVTIEAPPAATTTPPDEVDELHALWSAPAIRGPRGTVPVIRPNYDYYTSGESKAKDLPEFIASLAKAAPQPEGQNRLYAAKSHTTTNIGTQGWINYLNPTGVTSSEGTFSLGQLAVRCDGTNPNTTMEAIEVGIQDFPQKYGDTSLHFFTYFRTAGRETGDLIGGYNMDFDGFVQTGSFPPGAVVPNPPSGTSHVRRIRAVLSGDAWWVQDFVSSSDNQWVGYYPIGTGSGQINFGLIDDDACQIDWYGEVFDPTENTPNWTNANMGNGIFGRNTGSLYFRGMIVERASGGNLWFNGSNSGALDTTCYDTSALSTSSTPGWEVSFRWGGPGGDATGCN